MVWPYRRLRLPPLEVEEGEIDESLLDFPVEKTGDSGRERRVPAPWDSPKPVLPATSYTSEETHGGAEATGSIEGSEGAYGEKGDGVNGLTASGGGGGRAAEGESGGGGGGEKNDVPVVKLVVRELQSGSKRRAIARVFELIVMELGEAEARDRYTTRPSSKYDTRRIMLRPYERRPLSWYRVSSRQTIVVIVDTSGSMSWLSRELQLTSRLLVKRGDIELYEAPNGIIKRVYLPGGRTVRVKHEKVLRALAGRTIVYIGDFDGSDTPIILSRRNRVLWVATEFRYVEPHEHDWTTVDEPFRGVFIRVKSLAEVLAYIKRIVRSGTAWIDPYRQEILESEEYEYEED